MDPDAKTARFDAQRRKEIGAIVGRREGVVAAAKSLIGYGIYKFAGPMASGPVFGALFRRGAKRVDRPESHWPLAGVPLNATTIWPMAHFYERPVTGLQLDAETAFEIEDVARGERRIVDPKGVFPLALDPGELLELKLTADDQPAHFNALRFMA